MSGSLFLLGQLGEELVFPSTAEGPIGTGDCSASICCRALDEHVPNCQTPSLEKFWSEQFR